jgi:hypothetical protein
MDDGCLGGEEFKSRVVLSSSNRLCVYVRSVVGGGGFTVFQWAVGFIDSMGSRLGRSTR